MVKKRLTGYKTSTHPVGIHGFCENKADVNHIRIFFHLESDVHSVIDLNNKYVGEKNVLTESWKNLVITWSYPRFQRLSAWLSNHTARDSMRSGKSK